MAKGAQRVHASAELQWLEALVNAGEPWPNPFGAWQRVRQMQAKLHRWAAEDPGRRFDDLFSLVYHPDFLTVAWERVSGNKGARTAGVDRVAPASISGYEHPGTMAGWRGGHRRRVTRGNPWSARCAETRTAGAEGGSGKRAGRDPGTAPWPDPYRPPRRSVPRSTPCSAGTVSWAR